MRNLRAYDILSYVKQKKRCSLVELMKKFKVSSATIHRDVAELVSRNAVERVRGGIVFTEAPTAKAGGSNFQDRVIANLNAKEAIARKAVALVTEGDILFLDSSTTVHAFAMELRKAKFTHLTIVTNSVSILQEFKSFPPNWVLVGLGGTYDAQLNAFIGADTRRQIEDFSIAKSFISAFGLNDKIATTNHERQVDVLKFVLDKTEQRYLLIDRSKLGKTGLYRLAARGTFDKIIS